MRAFIAAADQPWAITAAALEQILQIASRDNLDPDAVAAKLGRPLNNTRTVDVRDGVAIVPVTGPIFPRANLFTEISGGTSVQVLATDFNTALSDPNIKAIVLDFDTPGGAVAGINEFADMVYNARGVKPIVAYVGVQAASGGYWIAAAADSIVIDDTAILGSIGTVVTMDPKSGNEIEIVSSQSPLKRAGPETDTGRAHIQGIIDDLADVFIASVARGRDVSVEDVLSDFGQGGQLVGAKAIEAGMADQLGSLESVISELTAAEPGSSSSLPRNLGGSAASQHRSSSVKTKPNAAATNPTPAAANAPKADQMDGDSGQVRCPNCGTVFDAEGNECSEAGSTAIRAAAVSVERARVSAILALPEAKGREDLARTIALETDSTAEAAAKLLAAAPKAAAVTNPLAAAMANVANPNVGAGSGAADNPKDDDAAEVAAIVGVFNGIKGAKK